MLAFRKSIRLQCLPNTINMSSSFMSTVLQSNHNSGDETQQSSLIDGESYRVQLGEGIRTIELMKSSSKNLIDRNLALDLTSKLNLFSNSDTIECITFATEDQYVFSNGIDEDDLTVRGITLLNDIKTLVTTIDKANNHDNKVTVSVLEGTFSGSGLGIFSASKFKLATDTSKLKIDELYRGYLPIGFAYFMCNNQVCSPKEGKAFARYLALSQREVEAIDLFSLGLVTHLTEEKPHEVLHQTLTNSFRPGNGLKSKFDHRIDCNTIATVIDDMHFDFSLDISVTNDPLFDELFLVNVDSGVPDEEVFDETLDDDDIRMIKEDVNRIFGTNKYNHNQIIKELAAIDLPWAKDVADNIKSNMCDPVVIESWYHLTEMASEGKKSLQSVLNMEMNCNEKLWMRHTQGIDEGVRDVTKLFEES